MSGSVLLFCGRRCETRLCVGTTRKGCAVSFAEATAEGESNRGVTTCTGSAGFARQRRSCARVCAYGAVV